MAMVFGGVFALLGLLMVFAVVHSAGAADPQLLARNWLPLAGALGLLLGGAAIFGTAFRLHALTASVGRPRVSFQPVAARAGTRIEVETVLEPETAVLLEEAVVELHPPAGAPARTVLAAGRRIDAGSRALLTGVLRVPPDAQAGEHWTLVVRISVHAGADWREEHPLEIVPG